jgi:hypothetical protein
MKTVAPCFSAAAAAAALAIAIAAVPRGALGQSADAEIDYDLGLANLGEGAEAGARAAFQRACLADAGVAAACLEWARLVEKLPASDPERDRDLKRALGSAVVLAPDDLAARYALALMLLEKQDWTWAIEHLEAALATSPPPADEALLRYYLGYALLESGATEDAAKQLAAAQDRLPAREAQRCRYYRAVAAERREEGAGAEALFRAAETGPDAEVAGAVRGRREAHTAFPRADGFHGQLSASLGMNTHPTAAVFDDPGAAGSPVLESVLRGDLMFGAGSYTHGFLAAATVYRDQSWTEIGPRADGAKTDGFYVLNRSEPADSNLTHFQAQLSYARRGFGARFEHEVRLGLDVAVQFLDREVSYGDLTGGEADNADPCEVGVYEASADAFKLYAYSIGERAWWSFAKARASAWSLQLKHEVRPNEFDEERSANRFRLRAQNTRSFLGGALQLKAYAGGYYDRTYGDPDVVKFDKLVGEASAELKWNTPLPYLGALVGGKLSYHWYLNSKGSEDNSFRPGYVPNGDLTSAENEAFASEYYDLERRDFEWELSAELQLDLWKGALLAVRYVHHARLSNIDDAPRPVVESGGCGDAAYLRLPLQKRGYEQDIAALELRQTF